MSSTLIDRHYIFCG